MTRTLFVNVKNALKYINGCVHDPETIQKHRTIRRVILRHTQIHRHTHTHEYQHQTDKKPQAGFNNGELPFELTVAIAHNCRYFNGDDANATVETAKKNVFACQSQKLTTPETPENRIITMNIHAKFYIVILGDVKVHSVRCTATYIHSDGIYFGRIHTRSVPTCHQHQFILDVGF